MVDDNSKLSITYSSGLIPPPELMSTLAVFYDEIWLPFPFDIDPNNISKIGYYKFENFFAPDLFHPLIKGYLHDAQDLYLEWIYKYRYLFNKGIINQVNLDLNDLQHIDANYGNNIANNLLEFSDEIYEKSSIFKESIRKPFKNVENYVLKKAVNTRLEFRKGYIKYPELVEKLNNLKHRLQIYEDAYHDREKKFQDNVLNEVLEIIPLAFHHVIDKKPSPEFFISNPLDTTTSRLAGVLANSIFHCMVPQLQALNAEQILEVRDYLKDTKEGFTHYLFEMVDDVEQRLQSGDKSELEAAQKTVERKLAPQYDEFRRQLIAKNTGFWSKVLATGGKFLQVDAAPWTPKFWGAVLEMFGVSLSEATKADAADLSNKAQAFHYLAKLESKVSNM